ncbi:MAG: glycerophosphodiester phosphodiesterase family protein [Methylocystis sp.]|uniref:glycerophosphodiester phosphodiesterase family protein n=1 Tax=Methylocystis sp. TaxID=1911079 RepID=UPI0039321DAF
MRKFAIFGGAALAAAFIGCAPFAQAHDDQRSRDDHGAAIQLGPRPFYLVDGMDEGPLKQRLTACKNGPFERTSFSIGHRGGALQFPEHTVEAYNGGARMGAGIVECDVTFTKDRQLVCRHAQNDLHTTTNILLTPLASKCIKPFVPAAGAVPASAECRTSELTLGEFKTLRGKMDAFNPAAKTPQEFQGGTPSWRTELYTGRGTLVTMRESIRLNKRNGVKHTPELKEGDAASIASIFGGQEAYAQAFANVLREEGVEPRDVFPQSFNVNDILYWIAKTPYGGQATFLIDYDAAADNILLFNRTGQQLLTRAEQMAFLAELKRAGVRILAPAMPALLAVDGDRVVASRFAKDIKSLGFEIITWTFERADLRQGASKAGFYYDFDPAGAAIKKDSDMYKALDALAREVKIIGIFSDWPATVTYYANCMGLR